ncbi:MULTISPECIES: CBS domain-containing protein [Methylophaga]|jgi:predicted transcriptional regulator|uniref:Inosine 5'-monophosphate dehydrogenase n=1 Tax=Methylophaga muralis TaxID=291169 RepID=A0A1E3GQX9_9GAMM|nr:MULTISPECIES: CBS domain-containing protein [Methylophaga]ODN66427.1 inosine 5'-monophosphate dehydrogenase [Methylophaga muralis]THK41354.1 CBS domain-containing protein [Methylophaga sp. SB9B]
MLASLKVKDHMNGTKITFTPEMDVLRAIHQLIEFKISGAPVIDQRGNLIGFLSEKDCMQVALNAAYQGEAAGRVEEYMHNKVETIDYEASIIEVAQKFLQTAYKCLPVIKENRLVGSITRQNILKALELTSNPDAKQPAKQSTKQNIHVSNNVS